MPPLIPPPSVTDVSLVRFQLAATTTSFYFPQQSPAEDTYLPTQYTARNIVQRKKNQMPLRELLKLDNTLPIVGVIVSGFNKKQLKLLEQIVEASGALPLQLVLIGADKELIVAKSSKVKKLVSLPANVHLFFGAADVLVLPAQSNDALVAACFRYGLVPVVQDDQTLVRDYDPVSEEGNAFSYQQNTIWSIFAALIRALETHRLSYDWQRIQRNGLDMSA